jgi:hypothetical protein
MDDPKPTMPDPTITCPSCAGEIRLTESLAAPMLAQTRRDYEARIAAERRAIAEREAAVEAAREAMAAEIEAKLAQARRKLAEEEAEKARAAAAAELESLRATMRAQDEKLSAAQAAQAEFLRKARALEDERRELELTVETRVAGQIAAIRDKARIEAEEGLRLKVAEKEATISGLQRQIEEMRRRAEQGSQQLQGEVLELELENRLRARFPGDAIEPVPKGESGADVIQRVMGPGGDPCGAVLWESKRTKNWSDGWIAKLKADQRALGAEVALIVSEALPKGVENFDNMDGVWVASSRCAIPLACALRQGLIGVNAARIAREGQATKMELVYDYLTGPRFRHRVEAIVERVSDMSADLDRERKAMTRLWAKREMQIQGVVEATMGMYGDLQGIAGKALEEIEGLELPLLSGAED